MFSQKPVGKITIILGFSTSNRRFGICQRYMTAQRDPISRLFPLLASVSLKKSQRAGRWTLQEWILTDVLLMRPSSAIQMRRNPESGLVYHWHGLVIRAHKKCCESYYQNLRSDTPKLFVICRLDENRIMQPIRITVDCDESTAHMEADDTVFFHPMPRSVVSWLENFVVEFYCPEPRRKRERQDWKSRSKRESQVK